MGEFRLRDYRRTDGTLVQRSYYSVKAPRTSGFPEIGYFNSLSISSKIRPVDYAQEAKRRAFSLASLKLALNPDMTCFVTLTYDPKRNSSPDYLNDLKNLFRGTNTKYLATFERHKKNNPLLHIHIICTPTLETYTNQNNYLSIKRWHRGFSSVKFLSDFDDNFRTMKYIFKYMNKSEKVKHKYVYSSRNLLTEPEYTNFDHELNIDYLHKLFDGLHVVDYYSKYKVIKGVYNGQ